MPAFKAKKEKGGACRCDRMDKPFFYFGNMLWFGGRLEPSGL